MYAIRNDPAKHLKSLPVGINERHMSLDVCISINKCADILSRYATTMYSSDEIKRIFYSELHHQLRSTSIQNKLFLVDCNSRAGCGNSVWRSVNGKHLKIFSESLQQVSC